MYKKKISTIAIITILTLTTLLAAIPMASAINNPTLYDSFPPGAVTTGGYCYSFIDVEGTGATAFGKVEVYWDTLATKLGEGYADSAGNYEIERIVIPFDVVGTHNVIVYDDLSSDTGFTTYDIIPGIFLSTNKALPGDSVMVMGSGFGDELDVQIYLGAITAIGPESVTLGGTPVTGTLAVPPAVILSIDLDVDVTIDGLVGGVAIDPLLQTGGIDIAVTDDGEGNLEGAEADVTVQDDAIPTNIGEVDVTITGTINYATGVITLIATGVDSAGTDAVTDIVVTIDACDANYDSAEYLVTPAAGVTTDDEGSFTASIVVPAIAEVAYGDYDVMAIDTDGNQNVPWFIFPPVLTVDYYITLDPDAGPTGITTTIEGRIKADTDYELRFNTVPIDSGTSAADGAFSGSYTIPAVLSIGTYPVDIVWEVTESRGADFDVTAPPQVVYAPTSAVAGTVVTISTVTGFPFISDAEISLYLGTTLVNSTALDADFGPTVASGPGAGSFTNLEFTVPTLTPGPYALKVIDEYGASTAAIYTFTVLPTPVVTAELRGTTYYPCCTLSFNIVTTETSIGTITVTIRDPSGAIWWTDATWGLTGIGIQSVYYEDQLVNGNPIKLPLDAPLGSWNWTVTYIPASTGILTKATGLFTVAAEPSQQDVLDQLTALEATLTTLITTTEGDIIAVINTKSGQIMVELDAIDAKLQGIEDVGVIIATDVDEIQIDLAALDLTVLDALGVQITAIEDDVATIASNIGTVKTAVSTLDAKVTSLSGDVATVSTTLGTLQGTVTAIEGSIATIDTDVGTLQADISAVQADVTDVKDKPDVDMLPAWIAVVLSLVAAIAAVFAVITIRQKIAG